MTPLLVVAILGLAGIFVAITNRGFGFALLFMATAPATGIAVGPVTLPDVFLLPALVVGLVVNLHRVPRFAPWWVTLPAVVALLVGIMAAAPGQPMLPTYLFAFSLVAVPVTLALHGTTPGRIRALMGAFVVGAAVNAVVGIYDTMSAGFSMQAVTGFGGARTAALTTHSNQLGLVSVLAVPLVLHLAHGRRSWWAALPVLVGGAVCSGSRGALLGLGVAVVFAILFDRRPSTSRMLTAVAGAVVAYFAAVASGLTFGIDRLLGNDPTAVVSDYQRHENAVAALAEWRAHPWLGVGFGQAEAHNLYLELARSGGLLVLVAFLVWVAGHLLAGRAAIRAGSVQAPAAVAMLVTWLLLAVQHNAVSVRFIFVPAGLVLACWLVARPDAQQRPALPRGERGGCGPIAASGGGVEPRSYAQGVTERSTLTSWA